MSKTAIIAGPMGSVSCSHSNQICRVLLTGATGFVGRHLLPRLVANCPEVEILTLDRDTKKAESLFPQADYPRCKHASVDDLQRVYHFSPEIVIHLAAFVSSRNDTEVIEPMLSANIKFGVLLLNMLSQCPDLKLFVNTGTFAEYSTGTKQTQCAYLYAATKSAFREFVEYYSNLCGFKYIHVVPYSIYGGDDSRKKVIDYIKESLDAHVPVKMTAGEQVLDFIHVEDIVAFYLDVVKKRHHYVQQKNGGTFHLGTGIGTSIRELSKILELTSGKRCNITWGAIPYRKMDIMRAVAPLNQNPQTDWKPSIYLHANDKKSN